MHSAQSRERDDVPLVPKLGTDGGRPGGPARDLDPLFDHRGGTRPMESPMRPGRPPRWMNNRATRSGPSIGRRMFRVLAQSAIAVVIAFGAAVVWQSYGDKTKAAVRIFAPSLGGLLPDATPAMAAATSRELVQQLTPIARDVAAVRLSVEQLAAKQEQMEQGIATLQQDLKQKATSPAPSRAAPAQPKSPQPAAQSFSAPPPPPPPPFAGPTLR